MDENVQSWEVFSIASSQMVVVGMGTPLGLEFSAIDRAMTHVGVHPLDWRETWEKVRVLGEEYARIVRQRDESSRPKGEKTHKADYGPPPMWATEEEREGALRILADASDQ